MQQLRITPAEHYAGLGSRFLAVIVDTFCMSGLFVVVLFVATAFGALDLSRYQGMNPLEMSAPAWSYVALYLLLFAYYAGFELARGATPGKMLLGMRVTALDGSRASPAAILVRNLVRVPEAIFYYLPSAVACLSTTRRQRLGDLAAHTVVVRRTAVVSLTPRTASPPGEAPAALPEAASDLPAAVAGQSDPLGEALDALKTAALGLRGAHHNYLRLSEREIERGGGVTAEFSPEYAAAWHTLADAVLALQQANTKAAAAAAAAGSSLQDAAARRPDLLNLCQELEPYFGAGSDEQVQDAYLSVARRESPAQ